MLELIIPVVYFCAVEPNESVMCSPTTAFRHEELEPVSTPNKCHLDAFEFASKEISEFNLSHPNKPVEFIVKCKRNSEKT